MTNKYLIIENGKVINIAIADKDFANEQGWVLYQNDVNIGDLYDGVSFSKPPRDVDAEWQLIREKRDALLVKSDLSVLPDRWALMTVQQQNNWTIYRQALRDIPTTFKDPKDVVFPTITE